MRKEQRLDAPSQLLHTHSPKAHQRSPREPPGVHTWLPALCAFMTMVAQSSFSISVPSIIWLATFTYLAWCLSWWICEMRTLPAACGTAFARAYALLGLCARLIADPSVPAASNRDTQACGATYLKGLLADLGLERGVVVGEGRQLDLHRERAARLGLAEVEALAHEAGRVGLGRDNAHGERQNLYCVTGRGAPCPVSPGASSTLRHAGRDTCARPHICRLDPIPADPRLPPYCSSSRETIMHRSECCMRPPRARHRAARCAASPWTSSLECSFLAAASGA